MTPNFSIIQYRQNITIIHYDDVMNFFYDFTTMLFLCMENLLCVLIMFVVTFSRVEHFRFITI